MRLALNEDKLLREAIVQCHIRRTKIAAEDYKSIKVDIHEDVAKQIKAIAKIIKVKPEDVLSAILTLYVQESKNNESNIPSAPRKSRRVRRSARNRKRSA
jgi:fructose-1,6-bisphosphatase/sedoheptulose 1,7-bisphosphatase-like protein